MDFVCLYFVIVSLCFLIFLDFVFFLIPISFFVDPFFLILICFFDPSPVLGSRVFTIISLIPAEKALLPSVHT